MTSSETSKHGSEFTWIARLALLRDAVFVRQMALVFVVPLLVLGLLLVVLDWPPDRERLGLILRVVLGIAALFLALYAFVIFGVLRGRQEIRYTLDETGVRMETAGPLKYMNWVRLLLVLSGKPTYAGIGLITPGPQADHIPWKQVQKVIADPQAMTITLRRQRTDLMVIYCTAENYEQVLTRVRTNAAQKET